jgi:predicted AlkP superfamily phosphohydrolase/phosphomutase
MLGIDGLPPPVFRRFLDEGVLPNCARLQESAAWLDVVPTLPAVTCPGWLTIASGAHPATLGVANILQPVRGHAPDTVQNGFDSRLSRAEYIWETLARAELPAIVLKYPGSWPPRSADVTQVDGGGGYADITCPFELVSSATYSSTPPQVSAHPVAVPDGYGEHWRIDSGAGSGRVHARARDPLGWEGLPPRYTPIFEAVLPLEPRGQRQRDLLHVLACELDGESVLVVAAAKRWTSRLAELRVGEWSDWIARDAADGRYALRLKLLELDPANRRMEVYRSEGHRLDGFTVPDEVAAELVAAAGPVVEWTGTFDLMGGLIDLATQLEVYADHTAWLQRAVRHLAATRPWHGFFMQWHVVEYAHHIAGAALDDHHAMRPAEQRRYLDFLRDTYRLMDELVGTVLECAGDDSAIALVSDHGHDLVHTLFHVNEFLRAEGWLTMHDGDDGVRIDWSKTDAYGLFPGMIVLNRRGEWSGGKVSSADAPKILADIATRLLTVRDPDRDDPVVTAVLDRDAMAEFGQGGPHAPDVFFTLSRGYEVATRMSADADAPLFAATKPGHDLTSGHGSFHPRSDSARTLALIRHTTVTPGSHAGAPVAMSDLAPTFADIMGIESPRDADGRAIDLETLGVAARVPQP